MAIDAQPTVPNRLTQTQAEFSANASNIVDWMGDFATELNSVSSTYYLSVSTTSVTSNSIGTGSKSFTVQTGLGFVVGNAVRIANSGTNYMSGDVTSYNSGSGALVVNVTGTAGSGTYTSWTISLAAVGASAASDISNTPAGNISATTVQAAINELDTEKLSTVTSANMDNVVTGAVAGSASAIPVLTINDKGRVTNISSAAKISQGTAQATTSGTSKDYTSITSTAKRITLNLAGVSTNGTSNYLLQLGDSGGIENTGYLGATWSSSAGSGVLATAGAALTASVAAATIVHGVVTITLLDSSTNTWLISGHISYSNAASIQTFDYSKSLSATLDRIRLTTINGTDAFDAGTINIQVE